MSTNSSFLFRSRALVLAVLVALFGYGAVADAAPAVSPAAIGAAQHTVSPATRQKLSALAKTRDRNEKGQFLPTVNAEAVQVRAYQKFEARNRQAGMVINGHDVADYTSAKRELQDEKMVANKAARDAQKAAQK